MSGMHFVFHPHHDPVIVPSAEYQKYLDDGWYDTPAKFPANISSDASVESVDSVESPKPKKKGRPPKVKPEEVQVSPEA